MTDCLNCGYVSYLHKANKKTEHTHVHIGVQSEEHVETGTALCSYMQLGYTDRKT